MQSFIFIGWILPSPLPPDHEFSLHPHALNWCLLRQPGAIRDCPCTKCLFCGRHSAGPAILFNSHNNPMRCIITLLHLLWQNRKLRSQRCKLAHEAFIVTVAGPDSGWLASSRLTWRHCLGLWPVQKAHEELLRKKSCFWTKGLYFPKSL